MKNSNLVTILFIGDVVGKPGCAVVKNVLPKLKKEYEIDLVIANAENSAQGNGVSLSSAQFLFDCGCDILTGGNHSFRQSSVFSLFRSSDFILRPANLSRKSPGRGYCIFISDNFSVAVVNLMGQAFLNCNCSAFDEMDFLLKKIKSKIIVVDFHAEATGEKGALAYYLNGKVSAVVGTHTHVQTNDARILSGGTGFITDVGMVGPYENSVLGVVADCVIRRITTQLPTKFEVKMSKCIFNGVILTIDAETGFCEKITNVFLPNIQIDDLS